jgi:hypothetical protein
MGTACNKVDVVIAFAGSGVKAAHRTSGPRGTTALPAN